MARETKAGIIGGSGLYDLDELEIVEHRGMETAFGAPSDDVLMGRLGATEAYFIPRHGKGHRHSPSTINYRANILALKQLGAEWCISVSAVGSLDENVAPGDIVIPDQIIDRTRGRESTFFDDGLVAHVSFADPYCEVLSGVLKSAAEEIAAKKGFAVHQGGSLICMEGPAFSTRAESHLYRSWGARIIGMTGLPEAKLAREAEMAYATLALVTDYDCWRTDIEPVEVSHVLETMRRNTANAKEIVALALRELPNHQPSDYARSALSQAIMTAKEHISPETRERLNPLISKYL